MNMMTAEGIAPLPPRSLEDTGLSTVMMRDLLLKTMFRTNIGAVRSLGEQMCLPVTLTQELIDLCRKQGLVEAMGSWAHMKGVMRYLMNASWSFWYTCKMYVNFSNQGHRSSPTLAFRCDISILVNVKT